MDRLVDIESAWDAGRFGYLADTDVEWLIEEVRRLRVIENAMLDVWNQCVDVMTKTARDES